MSNVINIFLEIAVLEKYSKEQHNKSQKSQGDVEVFFSRRQVKLTDSGLLRKKNGNGLKKSKLSYQNHSENRYFANLIKAKFTGRNSQNVKQRVCQKPSFLFLVFGTTSFL